jgi:hypothetical protein
MSKTNFEPPPRTCERLEQIIARFGGTWATRSPVTRLDYALPAVAAEEIRAFLSWQSSVVTDGGFIARLPDGRVFGAGIVLAPDGQSLARDVSTDFGRPFTDHWLLTFPRIPRPTLLAGCVAVTATTLSSGYSHWLLDELPRLLVLPRDQGETIIGQGANESARTALGLRGGQERVIAPGRTKHFQCDQLVVPSLPSPAGYPAPATLELLGDFVTSLREPSSPWGERIYISREKTRRRRVSNEIELWPRLESRGFRRVKLEELTWKEQINVFSHAKEVVAPHGAGLANLVFCRTGTKVVELFNRAYVNGCYWRIAALKQLDYRPLVSAGRAALSADLSANRMDIPVEVAEVIAGLGEA